MFFILHLMIHLTVQSRGAPEGTLESASNDALSNLHKDAQEGAFKVALNPIQDWGGKKATPTSFSPATSTNVGFGPQNFLAFSFNPFATLVQNFKFVPSASPKSLNLNQDHSSKKAIFLVKSLEN